MSVFKLKLLINTGGCENISRKFQVSWNQIYFFAKFRLTENNFIDKTEFRNLCKLLVDKGIIILLEEESENIIGFKSRFKELDFLDKPFLAFDFNADTIKQWLQISTNGKYSFASLGPDFRFIQSINKELVTEHCNSLSRSSTVFNDEETFRLSNNIKQIDTNEGLIKEDNLDSSYKNALFLYRLFEDGLDLDLKDMNNVAYVFLAKNKLDQSFNLLNNAIRRISIEDQSSDNDNMGSLILYNLAIVHIKKGDFQKGYDGFETVINYCIEKENIDDSAGVLNILELDENSELIISEKKEGDPIYTIIKCSSFAEHNIEILKKSNKLYP